MPSWLDVVRRSHARRCERGSGRCEGDGAAGGLLSAIDVRSQRPTVDRVDALRRFETRRKSKRGDPLDIGRRPRVANPDDRGEVARLQNGEVVGAVVDGQEQPDLCPVESSRVALAVVVVLDGVGCRSRAGRGGVLRARVPGRSRTGGRAMRRAPARHSALVRAAHPKPPMRPSAGSKNSLATMPTARASGGPSRRAMGSNVGRNDIGREAVNQTRRRIERRAVSGQATRRAAPWSVVASRRNGPSAAIRSS